MSGRCLLRLPSCSRFQTITWLGLCLLPPTRSQSLPLLSTRKSSWRSVGAVAELVAERLFVVREEVAQFAARAEVRRFVVRGEVRRYAARAEELR